MILQKVINICGTEEITNMQMKEIHSKKEVSGISRNKNGRKHKKRKEDQITYRTMKIRKDQLRPCMGRNVCFVDKLTNQETSCIWIGMPQVQKEESLRKILYDKESTRSIFQV